MRNINKGNTDYDFPSWEAGINLDGTPRALVTCPGCGRLSSVCSLELRDDGRTKVLFICGHPDCEFKDFIKLMGWDLIALAYREDKDGIS